MHRYIKTLVKVILTILPVFCILMFALSVGALVISLNPDVKWHVYVDVYLYIYYKLFKFEASIDGVVSILIFSQLTNNMDSHKI
jgi:hypothetical protein